MGVGGASSVSVGRRRIWGKGTIVPLHTDSGALDFP